MSANTKKEVLVEYSIDTVYDTLIFLFPVKYYRLYDNDDDSHTVTVYDSSNDFFIMYIKLVKNTQNTTYIYFEADYPNAVADLTGGGKQAIDTVLEELLSELEKTDKTQTDEDKNYLQNHESEVVNSDNFVNESKTKSNTLTVAAGYLLCILSFVLPAYSLINYESHNDTVALMFVIGVFAFTFAIVIATILQYSENPKSKMHGRIQTILIGLLFITAGFFIHYSLAIGGMIIIAIIVGYFILRERSISQE